MVMWMRMYFDYKNHTTEEHSECVSNHIKVGTNQEDGYSTNLFSGDCKVIGKDVCKRIIL